MAQASIEQEEISLEDYRKFVDNFCFPVSKDSKEFNKRMNSLSKEAKVNFPMLLTAVVGLAAEGGEFASEVKKLFFHEKKPSEENINKIRLELGDAFWYITLGCLAIDLTLEDLMKMNVKKLTERHGS